MPAAVTVDTGHISYRLVGTDVNTDNRETSKYNTGINRQEYSVQDKDINIA